jgi:hypothetical protein
MMVGTIVVPPVEGSVVVEALGVKVEALVIDSEEGKMLVLDACVGASVVPPTDVWKEGSIISAELVGSNVDAAACGFGAPVVDSVDGSTVILDASLGAKVVWPVVNSSEGLIVDAEVVGDSVDSPSASSTDAFIIDSAEGSIDESDVSERTIVDTLVGETAGTTSLSTGVAKSAAVSTSQASASTWASASASTSSKVDMVVSTTTYSALMQKSAPKKSAGPIPHPGTGSSAKR